MAAKKLRSLCDKIELNNPSLEEVKKDLEKICKNGRPFLLVEAVKARRKDLIKLMIEDFGFDIDSSCRTDSALTAAIYYNDEDMVRFLVVEMKAEVNINSSAYYYSLSPLIRAMDRKNFQMVKLIVEELGADVNFKVSTNEDGSSPFLALHMAILHDLR